MRADSFSSTDVSPNGLLKSHSRTLLRQGDGLISHLSEDEKCALADELTRSGFRSYERSPTIRRTMSRALSAGSRRLEQSASSNFLGNSWLGQLAADEPAIAHALPRSVDVWSPTAADLYVPVGKSVPRESKRAKLNAMKEVHCAPAARTSSLHCSCLARHTPTPHANSLSAWAHCGICPPSSNTNRADLNRRWAIYPGLRRSGRSRKRIKAQQDAPDA
jgi:hypothetical protein